MTGRLAKVLAAAVLGALCASWGWRAGIARAGLTRAARPADYSSYGPAQLTWVEEGILERISKLEDELARVRELQGIQAE